MVAQSPPFALQNAQHSAALFRQAASSPFSAGGVLAQTDLAVTPQSTPNMSVQVAAGRVWIPGTQVANVAGGSFSTQASYFGLNDAPVTLTISAADPTNPRIDVVYVAVADSFYSGATNSLTLGVVTGIPAATPAVPTAPSNALVLGRVAVAANAASIGSANITQTAQLGILRGGCLTVTSTTRPASPAPGQEIFETDTRRFYSWDASLSQWWYQGGGTVPVFALPTANGYGAWPNFGQPRYWREPSGVVHLAGLLSSAAAPAGNVAVCPSGGLPVGYRPLNGIELVYAFSGGGQGIPWRFDLQLDGSITVSATPPASTWFSLNGIKFHPSNGTGLNGA